jgi:hypothetical protein
VRSVGLVVLRLAVAFALMHTGVRMLSAASSESASDLATKGFGGVLVTCATALAAGFLTPIVVTVVVVTGVAAGIAAGWSVLVPAEATLVASYVPVLELAILVSVGMLGPGAYSVDAHLFGRQEIIIPPRSARPTVDARESAFDE